MLNLFAFADLNFITVVSQCLVHVLFWCRDLSYHFYCLPTPLLDCPEVIIADISSISPYPKVDAGRAANISVTSRFRCSVNILNE